MPEKTREFSIAITTISDSVGITLAGLTGNCFFSNNYLNFNLFKAYFSS
jgi:hypothetical protein